MNNEVMSSQIEGISVGDIVTWKDRSDSYSKIQGKVFAINPGNEDPIEVEFFHESKWLFGVDWVLREDSSKPFTISFSKGDLQKEGDWDYQVLLKRNGADKCFKLYEPKAPLQKGKTVCMNNQCSELAQELSFVNIWGVMYIFHTCDQHHQQINGLWADSIPSAYLKSV